jgi:hypothetical protein
MEIPVLIEPVAGAGYRATSSRLSLSAEGGTRQEALARLGQLVQEKLRSGAELTMLPIDAKDNPWLAMAGMHDPNHPLVQEWKEIMAERRREEDAMQEAS